MAKILLVDDEPSILSVLTTLLRKQNHEVTPANGGEAAIQLIRTQSFDLILTDIRMEPVNGLEVLQIARQEAPQTAVILLTGYGSIKTAVEAMKGGAFDYVTKPFKVDELLVTVEKAVEYQAMLAENAGLRARLEARYRLQNIVAESPGMRKVCEMIERVAPADATVMIVGESGTGKELVARAVHALSRRKNKPFIPVNCAAMPEPLLESEMFGHVKGAFTGAASEKTGLFEAAAGGTIFLDEIGAMPLSIQSKFLRVLQDKHIRKVGGTDSYPIDVRVLAATNEPLERKMDRGEFREDLYYRISVIPLLLQPLRERREDILPMTACFLKRETPEGKDIPRLERAAERVLEAYAWPGNVRELENAMRHALTFCKDGVIRAEDLPARIVEAVGPVGAGAPTPAGDVEDFRGKSLKAFLRSKEKEYITTVIENAGGNKEAAARALSISLATLYRKLPDAE
jgi:two-component system, NtrC family, response regulator PilR